MLYGKKVQGRLVNVPETLGYTKPGEVYELQIDTEPFNDETSAIQQLLTLEEQVPDLKVLFIDTCPDGKVVMQIQDVGPGSISIGGLFSLIPSVFVLIGIIVVGVMLWQVMAQNPVLIYLLALAGGTVLFFYFIGKHIPSPSIIRTVSTKEKKPSRYDVLDSRRKAANRSLTSAEDRMTRARERKRTAQTTAEKQIAQREIDDVKSDIKEAEDRLKTIDQELLRLAR